MTADPSVSPADTIRQARQSFVQYIALKVPEGFPLDRWLEYDAAVDALLAVGERDRRQIAQLTEALERLEPVQQRVLGMIERNGFVFRTPLDKPDNERTEAEQWEKLAFTLYAEICETDTIVRAVLADEEDAANG